MAAGRVAIIGDIHGHVDELERKLLRLGMDPSTRALPEDLTVIQVGDLIHRGPQSGDTLRLVDQILNQQPDQWLQLIGNHEAQYVYRELFVWPERLAPEEGEILLRWMDEGLLHAAACTVSDGGNEALVTHAGLTYNVWGNILSRPRTAQDAASRINAGMEHATPWLWAPGSLLHGTPNRQVGPIWAAALPELYASWMNAETSDVPAPFSQVHGHSSAYKWPWGRSEGGLWPCSDSLTSPALLAEVGARVAPDLDRKHTTTKVANAVFIGVDPCHSRVPTQRWEPLLFHGSAKAPQGQTPEVMDWLNEE